MRMRRILSAESAVAFGSLAAASVIGELVLRMTVADRLVLFPRNHAAAVYGDYTLRTMTPNTVFHHQSKDGRWRFEINNKGFRDTRAYQHAKPEGVFRVMVLGDSHTAGFEVGQGSTFAAVLQQRFDTTGIAGEVINTGVSGMGTAEQLSFLENEGFKYSPDVVVVAFSANDFSDNLRSGLFALAGGEAVATETKTYVPAVREIRLMNAVPGAKWLTENSYAFSLALNSVWELFKARSINEGRNAAGAELAMQATSEASAHEIELATQLLMRLAQFARTKGIVPILLDIPSAATIPFESSIPARMRSVLSAAFTHILWSDDYLATRPLAQLVHVPNGHRHINEFTHRQIAETLFDRLNVNSDATHAFSPLATGTLKE